MKAQANRPPELIAFWLVLGLIFLIPLAHDRSLLGLFTLPKTALLWLGSSALLIILSMEILAKRRVAWPTGWAGRFLGLYLALLIAATVLSIYPEASLFGLRGRYLGLMTYGAGVVLFYATWHTTSSFERLKTFSQIIGAGATLVATLAIAQRLGLNYPIDFSQIMTDRFGSTIGNPNFLGTYLAMSLAILFGIALGASGWARLIWWVNALLVMLALAGTNSLGAWFAAAAATALPITAVLRSTDLRIKVGGLVGASLALVGTGTYLITRSDLIYSLADRQAVLTGGLRAAQATPFFGSGLDTLRFIMPQVQPLSLGPRVFADAHNTFITLIASAGIFTALTLAGLIWVVLTTKIESDQNHVRLLGGGLKLAMVAFLIGHSFNPESIAPLALFWAIGGAVTRAGRAPAIADVKRPAPGAVALVLALLLFAWTAQIVVGLWRAERLIKLADRASDPQSAWVYAARAQESWPHYSFYTLYLFELSQPLWPSNPGLVSFISVQLDRTIEATRFNADAHYARAELNLFLAESTGNSQYSEFALREFEAALKFNRLKLPANLEAAKLYIDRGDLDKAAYHLDLLTQLISDDDEHLPEILQLRRSLSTL